MTNRLAQRFVDAWNRHDAAALRTLMTPDAVYEVVPQHRVFGPERLEEQLSYMESLSSDFSMRLVSTIEADERCAVEWRLKGTNDGPWEPFRLTPSGHRFEVRGVWLLGLRGEQIASCRAYWDLSGLLSQIGIGPPGEVAWQLDTWSEEQPEGAGELWASRLP